MKFFRLLLLSDIHGNVNGLRKLLNSRYSHREKFDAIVISGDFPITTPFSLILNYMIKNRNLSRSGYSNSVYKDELRNKFVHHQIASIKKMMLILERFDLPIIYIPGNIETRDSVQYLKHNFPNLINLDEQYLNFNEKIDFFGIGGSLEHLGEVCDYEFSKQDFNKKIIRLEQIIQDNESSDKHKIFIYHEPPRFIRTTEEMAFLRQKSKKRGYSYKFSSIAGSEDLYKLIERRNPLFVVNGHYHEYSGSRIVNNSTIVNPGAFATYNYAITSFGSSIGKNIKIRTNYFKIRPSILSFTNFLYQKRSFTLTDTLTHR